MCATHTHLHTLTHTHTHTCKHHTHHTTHTTPHTPHHTHHTTHTTPHTPHHTHHTTYTQLDFGCAGNGALRLVMELKADSLNVGDVLIFDGNVLHRGKAYKVGCVAAHIYLDVPSVKRPGYTEVGSFNVADRW